MNDLQVSKKMSYILRHNPESYNMDEYGYVKVCSLCSGLLISEKQLDRIVKEDSKGRYSFNLEGNLIKANQGHSIKIDHRLTPSSPPWLLWHGSGIKYLEDIIEEGIRKMRRHHVHLSDKFDTAVSVGKRHGAPIIYCIESGKMNGHGYNFYLSTNGVWLTDEVPWKYIKHININGEGWNKT